MRYDLKEIMKQGTREVYRDKKGFWNWIKRKLGMKVEQVFVRVTPLEDIADTMSQSNEIIRDLPFHFEDKLNTVGEE